MSIFEITEAENTQIKQDRIRRKLLNRYRTNIINPRKNEVHSQIFIKKHYAKKQTGPTINAILEGDR